MAEFNRHPLPAPVGGLNLRDNPEKLATNEALALINLFPETDRAVLRGGLAEHITSGLGGASVETLVPINVAGTESLISAAGGAIYDASTSSPSDITGAATITVDRWAPLVFSDADAFSAAELLLVNGTDAPLLWTGSGNVAAWTFYYLSSGTPTAFPASPDRNALEAFVGHAVHKNRWYGWQSNSRDFYYGQLGQKPGTGAGDAVTRFPLSAVRGAQGNIIAMETWTRDGGAGPDDHLVIITNAGSAIVYAGTDPGDATLWALVGVYTIPPPIDARCVAKFLDDIVIVTQSDIVFLSQAIRNQGLSGSQSKIAPLIEALFGRYGTNSGWELRIWPKKNRAYLNVPMTSTTSRQVVINTRTLAACEYEGWNARSFSPFGGELYFGDASGQVFQAEFAANDNGAAYTFRWSSPFFSTGGGWKQPQAMRVTFGVSEPFEYGYLTNLDFIVEDADAVANVGDASGWIWSTGTWGTIAWNTLNNTIMQQEWVTMEGGGEHFGFSVAAEVVDIALSVYSVNVAWSQGRGW